MKSQSTLITRFWKYVKKGSPNECWEWIGSRATHGGYGQINEKGSLIKAHRLSLEIKLGRKIKAGMLACHSCGNAPCCNPSHIYEGTHKQNHDDCVRHGRSFILHTKCGEKSPSAKLTTAQVKQCRSSKKGHTYFAKKFGVTKQAIFRIRKGLSWKSVL